MMLIISEKLNILLVKTYKVYMYLILINIHKYTRDKIK